MTCATLTVIGGGRHRAGHMGTMPAAFTNDAAVSRIIRITIPPVAVSGTAAVGNKVIAGFRQLPHEIFLSHEHTGINDSDNDIIPLRQVPGGGQIDGRIVPLIVIGTRKSLFIF